MRSWGRILLLLTILALPACSRFQDSSICYDQKSLSEKAIVVIDGCAPYKYLFVFDGEVHLWTEWERINPPANTGNKIEYQFCPLHRDHMILPGTYRLKGLAYQPGQYIHSIAFSEKNPITFTVAPGDFIYLGDIIIKDATGNKSMPLLEDAYEKAVEHVKDFLPDIIKPLEKRLINGLQPGRLSEIRKEVSWRL